MDFIGLGDEDQAAGVLVEPVDDAEALPASPARELYPQ